MDLPNILAISIFLVFVGALVLDWVSDRYRIEDEIENKGGHVIKISCKLFGPDGDWDTHNRFYFVNYIDSEGNQVERYCKTSYKGGTYWHD
jgi:hypothetical protein